MRELGAGVGALVVHTGRELHGTEIELSATDHDDTRSHTRVHTRPVEGRMTYAAVFDRLAAGAYTLWLDGFARARFVAVESAAVTELDWRGGE